MYVPWTCIQPRALPLEPVRAVGSINRSIWRSVLMKCRRYLEEANNPVVVVGKPSQFCVDLLGYIPARIHVHLDIMDDFPGFYFGRAKEMMMATEAAIAARADSISASSVYLVRDRSRSYGRQINLVKNACEPRDLPNLGTGHRYTSVLGYVGTIGPWFDWAWLARVARAAPESEIVLVGPIRSRPPARLPGNVHFEGPLRHREALSRMPGFAAGLIPFLDQPLTEAVDPIKYYEYLACGTPVLSSYFGGMREHEGEPFVHLVTNEGEIIDALRSVEVSRPDPDWVHVFRQENAWDTRFRYLLDQLSEHTVYR